MGYLAALLSVLLFSCITSPDEDPCGPAPAFPGVAASFDGDRASMSRDDYKGIISYSEDVSIWSMCVGSL